MNRYVQHTRTHHYIRSSSSTYMSYIIGVEKFSLYLQLTQLSNKKLKYFFRQSNKIIDPKELTNVILFLHGIQCMSNWNIINLFENKDTKRLIKFSKVLELLYYLIGSYVLGVSWHLVFVRNAIH